MRKIKLDNLARKNVSYEKHLLQSLQEGQAVCLRHKSSGVKMERLWKAAVLPELASRNAGTFSAGCTSPFGYLELHHTQHPASSS
jgi:hypothetical protein